jgi:hypothetical protein
MTFGLIFWILMLLWLVFGIWGYWQSNPPGWWFAGNSVFLFILFLLLGWKTFGAPVHP